MNMMMINMLLFELQKEYKTQFERYNLPKFIELETSKRPGENERLSLSGVTVAYSVCWSSSSGNSCILSQVMKPNTFLSNDPLSNIIINH